MDSGHSVEWIVSNRVLWSWLFFSARLSRPSHQHLFLWSPVHGLPFPFPFLSAMNCFSFESSLFGPWKFSSGILSWCFSSTLCHWGPEHLETFVYCKVFSLPLRNAREIVQKQEFRRYLIFDPVKNSTQEVSGKGAVTLIHWILIISRFS